MDGRLVAQVLVDRRRQPDSELAELRWGVSALLPSGRIAEDVVRVDERDNEAERLRRVFAPEPVLGLACINLVPAQPKRPGIAAAEVLRLRILAGVGGLPVREPIIALESLSVAFTPAAEERGTVGPHVERMRQVPLALVRGVVADLSEKLSEVRDLGRQNGLVPRLRAQPQDPPSEALDGLSPRRSRLAQDLDQRLNRRQPVARVGEQVAVGQGQGHAVLGRVAAGQQGGAAG